VRGGKRKLMTDEKKKTTTSIIRAGSLIRRNLRTQLAVLEAEGHLTFTEDKGVLDSQFIVTASPEVWSRLKRGIARFNAR
jgi:hypothetical protein